MQREINYTRKPLIYGNSCKVNALFNKGAHPRPSLFEESSVHLKISKTIGKTKETKTTKEVKATTIKNHRENQNKQKQQLIKQTFMESGQNQQTNSASGTHETSSSTIQTTGSLKSGVPLPKPNLTTGGKKVGLKSKKNVEQHNNFNGSSGDAAGTAASNNGEHSQSKNKGNNTNNNGRKSSSKYTSSLTHTLLGNICGTVGPLGVGRAPRVPPQAQMPKPVLQ